MEQPDDAPEIPPISPEDYPGLLPTRPLFASGSDQWRHVVLQKYQHPQSQIVLPHAKDAVLTLQLAGPVLVEDDNDEDEHNRISRWFHKGQLHLQPQLRPVKRTLKGRSDVVLIHLASDLIDKVALEEFDVDPAELSLIRRLAVSDKVLDNLGLLFLAEAEVGAPGTGLMADTLGTAIALNILRRHSSVASMPSEPNHALPRARLQRVIEYMRNHLDERLTLSELARLGGLSDAQFSRAFRDDTGLPPHKFLIDLRVKRARDLLEHTTLSISEISIACGFEQPNHFATMFRNSTGMSPRAWRTARRS